MTDGRGRARHIWLASLVERPELEVKRLMAGQAAIWPFHGAELPDALGLLLGGLAPDDEALRALDLGLESWLQAQRSRRPRDQRDHQAQVLRAIDAFDIIARLPLGKSLDTLWSQYVRWYSWVDQHDLAPNADLRAAFLRTLAVTQDRLSEDAHERHIPFWLDLCSRAGRMYPDRYIDLGLLGLRCLPLPALPANDVSNARLCVTGLLKWSLRRQGLWSEFAWRWLAIKHAFPRYAEYWRDLFEQVVFPAYGGLEREFYRAWAENAQFKRPSPSAHRPMRPKKEEVLLFAQGIAKLPQGDAIRKSRQLVEKRELYAQESGITVDVVATACNLGHRLLRDTKGPIAKRAMVALEFAMIALRWEPQNTHGWALWRDALLAGGRRADAEVVAWESIRRFPEVAVLSDNLSQIWVAEGRNSEARALLEETVDRTNDIISRTLLVTILLQANDLDDVLEAERLLRIGVGEGDLFSQTILAGLLMRRRSAKDLIEAERLLRLALERTGSDYALTMLAGLLIRRRDKEDIDEAEWLLRSSPNSNPLMRMLLAKLLLMRGTDEDEAEALAILRHDAPNDFRASSLLQRLGVPLEDPSASRDTRTHEAGAGGGRSHDRRNVATGADQRPADRIAPSSGEARQAAGKHPKASTAGGGTPSDMTPPTQVEEGEYDAILEDVIGAVVTEMRSSLKGRGRSGVSEIAEQNAGQAEVAGEGVRRPKTQDAYMIDLVRPFAASRRSAFFYSHGTDVQRRQGEETLAALADSDDLPLARFFLLGLQPWREPRDEELNSTAFGLALMAAFRRGSADRVRQLQDQYPQEAVACAVVLNIMERQKQPAAHPSVRTQLGSIGHGQLGPASSALLHLTESQSRTMPEDEELQLMTALATTFYVPMAL